MFLERAAPGLVARRSLDPGAPAGLTGGFWAGLWGAGLWGAGRGVGRGVGGTQRGAGRRAGDVAASGTGASGGHLGGGRARCRVLPASCSSSHSRSLTPSLSSLHFSLPRRHYLEPAGKR